MNKKYLAKLREQILLLTALLVLGVSYIFLLLSEKILNTEIDTFRSTILECEKYVIALQELEDGDCR